MKHKSLFRKIVNLLMAAGIVIGIVSGFSIAVPAYASETPKITTQSNRDLAESETGLYIVQLSDPSISLYTGGISGFEGSSPEVTGTRRLDPNSPASQAYLAYLDGQQQKLIGDMETAFGHPVEVQFYYQYALNGVAVRISHDEALQAFTLPGVRMVFPDKINEMDTDMGPTLIGAPSIWEGDTLGGDGNKGEGIVIGMIDSGINHLHPSFEATGDDGFPIVNPYGSGVFHGWCVGNPGFCNNKLIAAYGLNPLGGNPEDTDGHGSHTASTAGGDAHDAVFTVGTQEFTRAISGVAPHANIVAYKVCDPNCPESASVQAVNLAIGTDGVDAINYSISGSSNPWTDPVDLAFLNAFGAGIFVSASAGNSGPGAGTVAHTGPWNSTVAASTHSRIIANTLDVTNTPGDDLTGIAAVPGEGTSLLSDITDSIKWAGDVDAGNINACAAFPAASFAGVIGLAQRGGCTFDTKVDNLFNAGAVGVVIYNNAGGPPTTMGAITSSIPAVMITMDDGLAVVALITGVPSAEVTIYATASVIINPAWEDIMAGFSSRGPSLFDLLKPDYTAPGVNILAAMAADGSDPVQYGFLQGTSMSSPHSAGASALLMALRPKWTVAELRSALSSTADPDPVKDTDGITPADPLDMGSGRLDLAGAGHAGLVLEETSADYLAADPASGGDPKTLNQPSMVDNACLGTCTWTRTVKSVLPTEDTWTVTTSSGDPNLDISVVPNQFVLTPGQSVKLEITADLTAGTTGDELFGSVILTPTTASATRLPLVIKPVPVISVDPTSITSVQSSQLVTIPITITNSGSANLDWSIYDLYASGVTWSDNFDSYATGSSLHTQGGWKGWGNSATGTAYTSDLYSRSAPNSVSIQTTSDLVHEYAGSNSGVWRYSAWQYIPTDFDGDSYFIMLNQYDDAGSTLNFSVQVHFLGSANIVENTGFSGGALPLIRGQWVELRVDIDLTSDTTSFFYGGKLLYTGTWTNEVSGGGSANIGAVDLFANGSTPIYYDDISLGTLSDALWLSTVPTSGTTPPGGNSSVDVLLDATGLAAGEYNATLYIESNDPVNGLILVPVTMVVKSNTYLPLIFK